jgi:hypothetical protein
MDAFHRLSRFSSEVDPIGWTGIGLSWTKRASDPFHDPRPARELQCYTCLNI